MDFQEERAIVLRNDTSGYMYRLNYPSPVHFPKLRYKQRLLAAIGNNVQLQFNNVVPAQSKRFLKGGGERNIFPPISVVAQEV